MGGPIKITNDNTNIYYSFSFNFVSLACGVLFFITWYGFVGEVEYQILVFALWENSH